MSRYLIAVVFLAVFLINTTFAAPINQDRRQSVSDWLGVKNKPSLGLVDPSRLSVHHAFSFGASFGGDQSLLSSLYATNLTYQLSNPVTLNLLIGVQNNRIAGMPGVYNQTSLIGGFSFDYKPSKNMHFRLEMYQAPGAGWSMMSPSSPFRLTPSR